MCFITGGCHSTFGHFDHISKSNFLESTVHLSDRSLKLSQNRRGDDGYHLFPFTDALQYIERLRDFEDSPERTSIHAFSTVDTLAFINVLYAVFIFADSFYRTRLFTRYGNIYNSVIRTTLVTNTATDTCVMVNHCLTVFLETYRIFRAVHVTTTCHASATKVGYFIIDLYTGRTGLVDDAHNIFLVRFGAAQCQSRIFGKRGNFVVFVCHIQSHQRKSLVPPHCAFFMYATPS